MTSRAEIVITGLGVLSPLGIGKEPFWTALLEGRGAVRSLPFFSDPSLPTPFGAVVPDFDPKLYVRPRKSLKVMNRDIQLGFAAADMACADARLRESPLDPERFGVMLGADMMPCDVEELVGAFQHCMVDGQFEYSRWGESFTANLFPLWMLKYLPNMPACHVGIAQDARGPNNTMTLGEVSTLSALGEAVRVIGRGQADVLIAGGASSRTHPALWTRHEVIGQSRCSRNPAAASRPFDARRDGVVFGEGAATVILETLSRAESRGASVLARVRGFAMTFESHAEGGPLQGSAIRRALLGALDDAGLEAAEIGFVAAHGASTIDGDRIEAQAIRDTLGEVPVTAAKSYFGHLGAASGALETVLCILALQDGRIPPTLNYEHPDPQCPIRVVHGRPMPLKRPTALILSHSPQGQAVAVVLSAGKALSTE
jgi:3-oxoacyl-[acyl-carrier-protein] synthase II